MRFKTQKNSETGQKFEAIAEKIIEANKAQKKFAKELEVEQWRPALWVVAGGISSCIFKTPPDAKTWKNVNGSKNEWMPKENTTAGKLIANMMKGLPTVSSCDLNSVIGFKGAPFKTIGFSMQNSDFFGFTLRDDWKFKKLPEDCVEITVKEYDELFNSKKDAVSK